jgi:hypothetical protein
MVVLDSFSSSQVSVAAQPPDVVRVRDDLAAAAEAFVVGT